MRQLSQQDVRDIKADVLEALKAVGAKHGVTFAIDRGKFTATGVTVPLVVSAEGAADREREEFERNVRLYADRGLKATDYKRRFVGMNGSTYILVGINPKADVNGFTVESVRGTRYRYPTERLLADLGLSGKNGLPALSAL